MLIKSLELKNYIPLVINQITHFKWDLTASGSKTFIILGTNGSAKSSVMRMLNPVPPASADFVKGGEGFKELILEHRGVEYILTSVYGSSNKHTFIRGDEILNDGGTAQVQQLLVKEHFNLDSKIMDLLNDRVKFTSMTPDQRREYIMMISGTDFTFALNLWRRIRMELSHVEGASKEYTQRLVDIQSVSDTAKEDVEQMAKDHAKGSDELMMLLRNVPDNSPAKVDEAARHFVNLKERLESLGQQVCCPRHGIIKRVRDVHGSEEVDEETTRVELQDARDKLTALEAKMSYNRENYDRIAEVVESLEATGGTDKLKSTIATLESDASKLTSEIKYFNKPHPDPNNAIRVFDGLLPELRYALSTLPPDPEGKYSTESINATRATYEDLQDKKAKARALKSRLEERVEHIRTAHKENCPACEHVYIPGVGGNELEDLEARLIKANEYIAGIDKSIGDLDTIRSNQADYEVAKQEWVNLARSGGDLLVELFRAMAKDGDFYKAPRGYIRYLDWWSEDLSKWVSIREMENKALELKTALGRLETMSVDKTTDQYAELARVLDRELSDATREQSTLMTKVRELDDKLKLIIELNGKVGELNELRSNLEAAAKRLYDEVRKDHLRRAIDGHQSWLGKLQDAISKSKQTESLLENLIHNKAKVDKRKEEVKLLLDEVGPRTGLIGDHIWVLIEDVAKRVNEIMGGLWTHEIELKPVRSKAAAIDYRFPIEIRNSGRPTRDANVGSDGEQDVVNFAFKLVAVQYLGFQDYPLYLDEISPALDEKHKFNIMRYVSTLVESGACSQLFLISHDYDGHGYYNNAEFIVTNGSNITPPPIYNEHVRMV